MRRLFVAAAAAATLFCSAAYADCAAEIETLAGGQAGGISKDGTHAPLATPDVATSAQDVAAQQEGQPTAAEEAAANDDPRTAALDKARAAAAAGDEAACMAALEEARGM